MLELRNVVCTRGERPLFAPVSLRLAGGELLHVRGPNGRGKTTLLRAVAGLGWLSEGVVTWDGVSVGRLREDYRREMLYLGHLNGLHGELTPRENIAFASALAGTTSSPGPALASVRLTRVSELPTKVLSQGQKRRVALARLYDSRARLWLLDEPFAALDVRAIDELATVISRHLERNGAVLLVSHQEVAIRGNTRDVELAVAPRH